MQKARKRTFDVVVIRNSVQFEYDRDDTIFSPKIMSKPAKQRQPKISFIQKQKRLWARAHTIDNLMAAPVPEWNPVPSDWVDPKTKKSRLKIRGQRSHGQKIKSEYKKVQCEQVAITKPFKERFKEQHAAYLKSSAWRNLRKQYRADSSRYQNCWGCGVSHSEQTHHFHHLHYRTFTRETLDDIIPLCEKCHNHIHDVHRHDNPTKASVYSITKLFCKANPLTV